MNQPLVKSTVCDGGSVFPLSSLTSGVVVERWRQLLEGESNPELGDVYVVESEMDISFGKMAARGSEGDAKSFGDVSLPETDFGTSWGVQWGSSFGPTVDTGTSKNTLSSPLEGIGLTTWKTSPLSLTSLATRLTSPRSDADLRNRTQLQWRTWRSSMSRTSSKQPNL